MSKGLKVHVFWRGGFLTNNHAYRRYRTEELLIRRLRFRAQVLHLEGEQVGRQGLPDGPERDLFRFSALMRQGPRSLCADLR
jgi:hypothetical protein